MTTIEIVKQKPLNYAPITIVEGEQKSGKSCFCVTRVVDPTFANITSVKLQDGTVVKAEPALNSRGYAITGMAKMWFPNPRVMVVPPHSCVIADSIRVFANFHLKGIRYVYLPLHLIIEYLNSGLITGLSPDGLIKEAFLIIDEAYIGGDKRDGMSPLVKVISKLGYQIAKRHLHVMFALPEADVLDFRLRGIETEHVICQPYDEVREIITVDIKNRKRYKQTRSVSFSARPYFRYYDADEQFELTNTQIARALASAV
jgi:hypothetical protein